MSLTVVCERPGLGPLAWIHRAEARGVARELAAAGNRVRLACLDARAPELLRGERLLLRVSDPRMLSLTSALAAAGIDYLGPAADVMARCYDKYGATERLRAQGIDCPPTGLASDAHGIAAPRILKPRCGSDSLGVRTIGARPVPEHKRTPEFLVQKHVFGTELTLAVVRGRIGVPLRIELAEGVPYSFMRTYLLRPRLRLAEGTLHRRAIALAREVVAALGADWAVRIDLIHETASGRLLVLECDAAPLIGARSAFAASLAAANIARREQLRLLLAEDGKG